MSEPIFNSVHYLIRPYKTATWQQWLPAGWYSILNEWKGLDLMVLKIYDIILFVP